MEAREQRPCVRCWASFGRISILVDLAAAPSQRCAPWSHPFDKFCSNLHVFPVSKGLGIQDQIDRSTDGPWACSASKLTAGPHGKCRWPCGSRAPRWRGFAPGAWRGMERGFSVGGAKWVRRPHPSLWPLSTTPNPNMESALAEKKKAKILGSREQLVYFGDLRGKKGRRGDDDAKVGPRLPSKRYCVKCDVQVVDLHCVAGVRLRSDHGQPANVRPAR